MREEISASEFELPGAEIEGCTQLIKRKDEGFVETNSVKVEQEQIYKMEIIWTNVIVMMILHLIAAYGFFLVFVESRPRTFIVSFIIGVISSLGVSVGSHRLWSHRSFKATLSMRILLMLMNTCANEDAIYHWARDHRVHHKYTNTNADPYNSSRGFFFSHMGWLMVKKHPDVKMRGKGIDLSDLDNDPVVTFQKKYYWILVPIVSIIIPTTIKMYFLNEPLRIAFSTVISRYVLTLHLVWSINSLAHTFGYKPFDISSSATENPYLGIITLGESWHNYHHAFPWDYSVPEVHFFNCHVSARFVDFFSLFGLTYDLKTVSLDLARKQAARKGDGTFKKSNIYANSNNDNHSHESAVWGWDDEELKQDDRNGTEIHARYDTRLRKK